MLDGTESLPLLLQNGLQGPGTVPTGNCATCAAI